MTTVVEPEVPSRRPRGGRLILIAAALVAAIALIIAAAVTLGGEEPPADVDLLSGPAQSPYVAEASFVLQNFGTLPPEAAQLWRDMTLDNVVALGIPFNRYNRYYTRFFLKEGETVEVALEANVPMGADLGDSYEGVSVSLIAGSAPYDQSRINMYLPQTEASTTGYFSGLERVGANWTVNWAITALSSDFYWLILTNTARQDAWCHFTVNIPAD